MVLKRLSGSGEPPRPPDDEDAVTPDSEPRMAATDRPVSWAALLERIIAQFNAETIGRPDLFETMDDTERRALLREVVDYVLAVESIRLPRTERLRLIMSAIIDVYNLGPLAPLLSDPAVTEIEIAAHDRIYARQGGGERTLTPYTFTDSAQWERILSRALTLAGVRPNHGESLLEVGATLKGRPARLEVTGPPISLRPTANIRLHPPAALSLPDLVSGGALTEAQAAALTTALEARRGIMIAGEPGAGKTTLLGALLGTLAGRESAFGACYAVERAAELRLPAGFTMLSAKAAGPTHPPISFADQIGAALAGIGAGAGLLVLDEVRFDEADAMWAALTLGDSAAQRQLVWAFRASTDPNRLRTAFGMAVRRAAPSVDQAVIVSALRDRLPVVAFVANCRLIRLCEWTPDGDSLTLRDLG
jgi:type IV secretory pathway ATPase VirB11/archaellum biosynthesis ATPase